ALDGPGVREVVENNKNGVLLPADAHQKAFSQAICDAASDPEKICAWQQHARQTALKFSRDACVNRLLDLYAAAVFQGTARAGAGDKEPWETFLLAIRTEWDLITEKAQSFARTVT
ncbi:MAG: glycosyltransferase family 4 protein, partial [Desulfotignum sp.]|nr:glycosyltransferase family 4 protein [Desulfotignum sp.]